MLNIKRFFWISDQEHANILSQPIATGIRFTWSLRIPNEIFAIAHYRAPDEWTHACSI